MHTHCNTYSIFKWNCKNVWIKRNRNNFSSFRIKTLVGGEESRGGEALGKPVTVFFKENWRHPKCCIPLHLTLLHPCAPSRPHRHERPMPVEFEMRDRSSGATLMWPTGPLPVLLHNSSCRHPSETEVHGESYGSWTSALLWLLQLLSLTKEK